MDGWRVLANGAICAALKILIRTIEDGHGATFLCCFMVSAVAVGTRISSLPGIGLRRSETEAIDILNLTIPVIDEKALTTGMN